MRERSNQKLRRILSGICIQNKSFCRKKIPRAKARGRELWKPGGSAAAAAVSAAAAIVAAAAAAAAAAAVSAAVAVVVAIAAATAVSATGKEKDKNDYPPAAVVSEHEISPREISLIRALGGFFRPLAGMLYHMKNHLYRLLFIPNGGAL